MRIKIWTAFILLTLIWGASFLWIKIAVLEVGPYVLVAFRLLFGLLGLVGFVILRRPRLPRDAKTLRALVVLGVLNSALPWMLISWAEETIDSALATVLNGTVPLFTILIAHLALRDDRMTVPRVMGLLLGFFGVLTLTQRGSGELGSPRAGSDFLGQLAMLAASASYAVSGVYARRNLAHTPVLVQAFYSMLVAAVLMWIALPFLERTVVIPGSVLTWVAIAWLGVLGAGIASYLFFFLLHTIGPTRSSLVTYTIPVVGVALGVLVLDERLDWFLVVGTILIVSGVWVVHRK